MRKPAATLSSQPWLETTSAISQGSSQARYQARLIGGGDEEGGAIHGDRYCPTAPSSREPSALTDSAPSKCSYRKRRVTCGSNLGGLVPPFYRARPMTRAALGISLALF